MTRYGVAILPVLALLAGCNTFSGVGKDLGAAKEAVVGGPSQPAQTAQGSATSKSQSSASQTSSGSQQNSASTSGYWMTPQQAQEIATMTPEQAELRQQKENWNRTVATGALAGAALGSGVGLATGGSNRGAAVLVGGLLGAAVGGLAGVAVANRNLKFENRELSAEQHIAAAKETSETRAHGSKHAHRP